MDTRNHAATLDLQEFRRRRSELREAIGQLEAALAAPAHGQADAWRSTVRSRLDDVRVDFHEHTTAAEKHDGLYTDVVAVAPRLIGAITRLRREHTVILAELDRCVAQVDAVGGDDVEEIRDAVTDLMARFVRHRQRGSELMWDAYASDIGGET